MKSIIHTIANISILALCIAWVVYGIDGAGNVYTAFAWTIAAIALLMVLALPLVKDTPLRRKKPKWRKWINTSNWIVQTLMLFWFGEMLVGGLILFACLACGVVTVATKEIDE